VRGHLDRRWRTTRVMRRAVDATSRRQHS
jgi:hypothetical protein